jgi:hypothetical protein
MWDEIQGQPKCRDVPGSPRLRANLRNIMSSKADATSSFVDEAIDTMLPQKATACIIIKPHCKPTTGRKDENMLERTDVS